ncbi:MAG: hypothetical protein PHR35_22980, partial [Kiritimatiellae bacterium]|nr:hypothetical protein [Kiritimatiellia bacterium]
MRKRDIMLYWLLIGVPALLLGLGAVRLLHGERARLGEWERRGCQERAERLADTVRGMVSAAQEDLMTQLQALPSEDLHLALRAWERAHPLVRNVFVWHPAQGVTLPAARGATVEERRFMQRYAPLWTGEIPWQQPRELSMAGTPPASTAQQRASMEIKSLQSYRARAVAKWQTDSAAPAGSPDSGWRCWFEGNQIHLLGWMRAPDGTVRGIEMETAALLARIVPLFEGARDEGLVCVLRDGEGRALHQVGAR